MPIRSLKPKTLNHGASKGLAPHRQRRVSRRSLSALGLLLWALLFSVAAQRATSAGAEEGAFRSVPVRSHLTHVQPMTGIVFWTDSEHAASDAIQLEYAYMKYNWIVSQRGKYDWTPVERTLAAVSQRKHQAILRFYDTYPDQPTTIPDYIKRLPDYHETNGLSEGKPTGFPDWSHPELQRFVLEFYTRFAQKYDRDPRLAFLETGFGLWAEYHIYDGPMQLGKTFPDKAFQATFLRHMASVWRTTPWLVSVDAAEGERTPLASHRELLTLKFGLFDDSFLAEEHPRFNEKNWDFFGRERYRRAPAGGEFSYYTPHDQQNALAPEGPHGVSFEHDSRAFHITFMIGNDQPRYRPMDRIRQAGLACGYRFKILAFSASPTASRVMVTNTGVAPLYYDAFVTVNGVRARASLKGLQPGERREFEIASGGMVPKLSLTCDRLVAGQQIEYEADLAESGGGKHK